MSHDKRETAVSLTSSERAKIVARLRAKPLRKWDTIRCSAILVLADGASSAQTARRLGIDPSTICRYKQRFNEQRLIWLLRSSAARKPRKYGPHVDRKIRDIIAGEPPDARKCWTAKLVADRLNGVHYQYVWSFIRKRCIDLCRGGRDPERRRKASVHSNDGLSADP